MTLLIGFLIPVAIVISAYMVYKVSKNPSVIDIAWGLNVLGSVIWYITQFEHSLDTINICFYALPIFWGLRLSMHISFRVLTEELDGRYAAFEKKWSSENANYKNPDKNYLQFFMVQSVMGFILSLPFYFNQFNPISNNSWTLTILGLASLCLILEALSDYQLLHFKRNKNKTSKVCRNGLWAYSRHPNYFFEISFWILISIVSIHSWWSLLFLLIPIMIAFFILNVTGIPATEQQSLKTKGIEYQNYINETNAIIPWPPKGKKNV